MTLRNVVSLMLISFFSGYLAYDVLTGPTDHSVKTRGKVVEKNVLDRKFSDLSGRELALNDWDAELIVVNFWGSWCPPCRKEMPLLSRLHKKYYSRGVQFIGIALDDPVAVANYLEEQKVSYPILWGSSNVSLLMSELGNKFGSLPFTAVVDSQNNVLFTYLGEIQEEAFTKKLEKLIKKQLKTPKIPDIRL